MRASLVAQLVKNPPACRRRRFDSWVRKIPWRRDMLPIPVFMSFPGGSAGKESTFNVGDLGSVPEMGRSPGEGNGYPLQCSGLENSMDYIAHRVTKSWTRLSDFHTQFTIHVWISYLPCCTLETNTTLYINYTSIKIKYKTTKKRGLKVKKKSRVLISPLCFTVPLLFLIIFLLFIFEKI